MIQKLELFPTLFLKDNHADNIDSNILSADILSAREKHDHYTSFYDKDRSAIYNLRGMETVREKIGQMADTYLLNVGIKKNCDQYNVQLWWNVYDQYRGHQYHNHANSLLSGTYYVRMNENCSRTTFQAPYTPMLMNTPNPTQDNKYIRPEWSPVLETGDLLMWPSWCWHMIHQQMDPTEKRITISFNVSMK